ncbi:hypothetical protein Nmel_018884 [Mimus melanotis]
MKGILRGMEHWHEGRNDETEDKKRQDVSCPPRRCHLCKHHVVTLSSTGVVLSEMPEGGTISSKTSWHGCCRIPRSCGMALDIESTTYKTLLEAEESSWVPPQPCVAVLGPWGSSRASGGWKVLEILIPSWAVGYHPDPGFPYILHSFPLWEEENNRRKITTGGRSQQEEDETKPLLCWEPQL